MILRTAQIARSEYEWAHHLRMARKAGVDRGEDRRACRLAGLEMFDAKERAALALTEGVMGCNVTDDIHAEVKKAFQRRRVRRVVADGGLLCNGVAHAGCDAC